MLVTTREELVRSLQGACLEYGQFTLRSGLTSNVYFDKYQMESDPKLLSRVVEEMVPLVPKGTEMLAGLELGGVPLAVILSAQTGLPCTFVRKDRKRYGTERIAEGADVSGWNVLVVEDVVTSGGQVIESVGELRKAGAVVTDVVCVIERPGKAREMLRDMGVELHAVFTLEELESAS